MAFYAIEITETLQKVVGVQAETEAEAYEMVKQAYENEAIVLDSGNFIGSSIESFEMSQEEAKKLYAEQNGIELDNEELDLSM